MKKNLLLLVIAMAMGFAACSKIPEPIEGIKFTDDKFKQALLDATGDYKIDINNDGEITEEEAAAVKKMNISGKDITNIAELRYFTNLEELDASNNKITSSGTKSTSTLDLSFNTKLTTLNLSNNTISTIDISKNVLLRSFNISNNQITVLDITTNILLTTLDISNNKITTIDITSNTKIISITVGGQTTTLGDIKTITVIVNETQLDNDIVEDKDDNVNIETNEETELYFDIDNKDVTAEAGEFNVELTANKAWTTNNISSWVTLTPNSGTSSTTIKVTHTANTSTENRETNITFTSGDKTATLKIQQDGKEPDGTNGTDGNLEDLEEEEL